MKRILIVLLILLIFPIMLNAACDEKKYNEFVTIAEKMTYDNSYNPSSGKFNITIYNAVNGMYITCKKGICDPSNDRYYYANSNGEIVIRNIKQGANLKLKVYTPDGCYQVKEIRIKEGYYNNYYGSNLCEGYEDKLLVCSTQYTSTPITDKDIREIISNYKKEYTDYKETTKKEEKEENLIERIKNIDVTMSLGIKIGLALLTCAIFIPLFTNKIRKERNNALKQ